MIIVTREEFIQWIKEQPDDRLVDMGEFTSAYKCGCVMVQYGREKIPQYDNFYCGSSYWWNGGNDIAVFDGFSIWDIIRLNSSEDYSTDYGTLKKCLIKH